MKSIDEQLADLVFEYTSIPSHVRPSNLIMNCTVMEEGIEALDAL